MKERSCKPKENEQIQKKTQKKKEKLALPVAELWRCGHSSPADGRMNGMSGERGSGCRRKKTGGETEEKVGRRVPGVRSILGGS